MPNWCNNFVEVSHEDPSKIAELAEAYKRGEFCQHVIPTPKELTDTVSGFVGEDQREAHEAQMRRNIELYGAKDWYDFQTSRWGTKWDVGGDDGTLDVHPEGKIMTASFDSAWAPPVGVYEELVEQGFEVRAYYYEGGMCFAGIWDNGVDDCYQDWGDSQGAKDMLPEDLDEFFAISESMAEYEEEERMSDDLYRWTKEGGEQLGLVEKS